MFYGHAPIKNGLFIMDRECTNGVFNVDPKLLKKTKEKNTTFIWHCRLGHMGKKHMQKLHNNGTLQFFYFEIDADGNVTIHRARLVAKGFLQIQGVHYDESFSPVSLLKSVRILLAIGAYFNYDIWQMDVKMTFLNGNLTEDVYMIHPEGFVNPKDVGKVCKLQRAIYGLRQASRSWNLCFDEVVKEFCFIQNDEEACVYNKESGIAKAFLILYVDDILLIGNDVNFRNTTKESLKKGFQ